MTVFTSRSRKETFTLGGQLAKSLKGGEVLALYGGLGAGKTSFAAGVINHFLPGKRVISPTFIIVRHYLTGKKVIKNILHVDLYRLDYKKDLQGLGLDDFFNQPSTVVIIEWADKMDNLLPGKRTDIRLIIKSDKIRSISVNKPEI